MGLAGLRQAPTIALLRWTEAPNGIVGARLPGIPAESPIPKPGKPPGRDAGKPVGKALGNAPGIPPNPGNPDNPGKPPCIPRPEKPPKPGTAPGSPPKAGLSGALWHEAVRIREPTNLWRACSGLSIPCQSWVHINVHGLECSNRRTCFTCFILARFHTGFTPRSPNSVLGEKQNLQRCW